MDSVGEADSIAFIFLFVFWWKNVYPDKDWERDFVWGWLYLRSAVRHPSLVNS